MIVNECIPEGVFWTSLYSEQRQVIAMAQIDSAYKDEFIRAVKQPGAMRNVLLHHLIDAGIPFTVLTPRSGNDVAAYIAERNERARIAGQQSPGGAALTGAAS
jgi:hypothetical protein